MEKEKEEDRLYSLDNVIPTKDDEERRKKINQFLWCSTECDKFTKFRDISFAIKTDQNTALTQTYFHPVDGKRFVHENEFTKKGVEKSNLILKDYISENQEYSPPSWFKPIPRKKLDLFMELFNVIEVPQIISSIRMVYNIITKLDINIVPTDIDDIRYIYRLKHSFQNIDFNEFIYCIASIDLLKKTVQQEFNELKDNGLSSTQELLYSVLVLFTVAATSVCVQKHIKGVPAKVQQFFRCKVNCPEQLNSCTFRKIENQFKKIPNFYLSPYYTPLIAYKHMLLNCNDDSTTEAGCKLNLLSNPIVQHVKSFRYGLKGKTVNFDNVVKESLECYRKNGCVIACLPGVENIPMVRDILASISVFQPLCSSPTGRHRVLYMLGKHRKAAMMPFASHKVDKGISDKRYLLKNFNIVMPKINSCILTRNQLNNITPANFTRAMNHVRKVQEEKKLFMRIALANKNATRRRDLANMKMPLGDLGQALLVYDTYNPSDYRKIYFDPVQDKLSLVLKTRKEQDPDIF